jgi:hypothetical protein
MVKRQVLLSIDDLKQLGIIKKYLRKKRRNKKKKLMNNNVRQNSNHMLGYSEVINNQQQVYRNNDLDNEKKRFEIKNFESISDCRWIERTFISASGTKYLAKSKCLLAIDPLPTTRIFLII